MVWQIQRLTQLDRLPVVDVYVTVGRTVEASRFRVEHQRSELNTTSNNPSCDVQLQFLGGCRCFLIKVACILCLERCHVIICPDGSKQWLQHQLSADANWWPRYLDRSTLTPHFLWISARRLKGDCNMKKKVDIWTFSHGSTCHVYDWGRGGSGHCGEWTVVSGKRHLSSNKKIIRYSHKTCFDPRQLFLDFVGFWSGIAMVHHRKGPNPNPNHIPNPIHNPNITLTLGPLRWRPLPPPVCEGGLPFCAEVKPPDSQYI